MSGAWLLRRLLATPVATVLTVLAWTSAMLAGGPGPAPPGLATGHAALAAGQWWTLLTAAAWWGDLGGYLTTSVLMLLLGGLAERRLGTWRALGLMAATQVGAAALVIGLVGLGVGFGGGWAIALSGQDAVGAGPGIVGAAMAASTRFSALWRRRLRLLVLVTALMLVAYSGELSDLLLLAAALLGLGAGRLLGHPARRVGPASGVESRVLVALLVAASAIGPVVAAAAQAPIGPLSVLQFVVLSPPPDAATVQQICQTADATFCRELQAQLRLSGLGPGLGSIVPVLLLLAVADGLRRGRRAALVVGIGLNLALSALGLLLATLVVTIPDEQLVVYSAAPGARLWLALVLPPLLPLAVAVLLWWWRDRFAVRAPAGTYRRGVAAAAMLFTGSALLYVFGGLAVADQFDRPPGLPDLLGDVPARYLPPGYLGEVPPAFLPQGYLATLLFEWTGPVFWLAVTAGLVLAFARPVVEPGDAAAAREILVRHGGANLAWMTTWAGNAHWVDGDVAVAYRVIGAVAVTVGDPVGAPARRPGAVAGFAAFCRERGWTPAFYSVTDETRAAAVALGWGAVQVAEESVLALPGLEFTGKRWQDIRTALNRAAKAGITAEWITYAHAPLAITDQIRAISEEWVADKGLPEMGFTLGGLAELADDAVRCLIAVDTERTVHGVISWLPVHRDGAIVGWTMDFMRRRSGGSFRSAMEFLIATAVTDLQAEGCELLSLSGAPLAHQEPAAGNLQRVLDAVGTALEPVYGFRSLQAFKAKFQPRAVPLFLAFPDPAALPAIAAAIGRAYLPHLTARQAARLLGRLRGR